MNLVFEMEYYSFLDHFQETSSSSEVLPNKKIVLLVEVRIAKMNDDAPVIINSTNMHMNLNSISVLYLDLHSPPFLFYFLIRKYFR